MLQYEIIFLLIVGFVFKASVGVSLDEELTITQKQKLILDQDRVLEHLPHDYMKQDIYLLRWLRARDFDMIAAERMLMDNLEWRKNNNMDTIHEEDWSDMERDYKYYTDGYDRDGRPICFVSFGSWDLRNAVLTGRRERLLRYVDKAIDHLFILTQHELAKGNNVTRANLIGNLAGYSVIEQGCLQCLQYYIHLVVTYEQRFPLIADKIILLNTPEVFELVLNVIRPLMSQGTRDALRVYGTNRQMWEPELFKDIDKDQLPWEIRGTKSYDDY